MHSGDCHSLAHLVSKLVESKLQAEKQCACQVWVSSTCTTLKHTDDPASMDNMSQKACLTAQSNVAHTLMVEPDSTL
jgi:hypothetical protein